MEVLVSMETVDIGSDVVGCEGVVVANSWYSCWLKATTKRDNKLLFRQNSHTKVIIFQYNNDCFTRYTCFVVIIPAFDIVGKLVLFSPSVSIWQLTILTDRVILKASARNLCDSLAKIVTVLPGDGGFCEYVVASNACLLIYLIPTLSCKEYYHVLVKPKQVRKVFTTVWNFKNSLSFAGFDICYWFWKLHDKCKLTFNKIKLSCSTHGI